MLKAVKVRVSVGTSVASLAFREVMLAEHVHDFEEACLEFAGAYALVELEAQYLQCYRYPCAHPHLAPRSVPCSSYVD